jgi:hypothetical protein
LADALDVSAITAGNAEVDLSADEATVLEAGSGKKHSDGIVGLGAFCWC